MQAASDASKAPLTSRQRLAYCSYAIPVTALPAAIVVLVPPFYSEVHGISLATVGAVFFALRMFDAITDPAMGWLLDRQPFEHAHRTWLVLALPVFLLGVGLLFFPPRDWASPAYLLVAGFLTYSAYTIGLVAHQAWGASIAGDPQELSRLFGYREYAVIAGILGVFGAPAAVEVLGSQALEDKASASGVFLIVTFLAFTTVCVHGTPDKSSAPASNRLSLTDYAPFLGSRHFVLMCATSLLLNFGTVTLSVLSFFIAAYVFDAPGRFGLGNICYFLSAAVGMLVWMRIAARIGDRRTFMLAAGYTAAAVATLPILAGIGAYLPFMMVLGAAFGAAPYLLRSILGSYANRYEHARGVSVRGAAYACATFCDKLGSGIAAGVVLPAVGALGFVPGTPTEEGVKAVLRVATLVPLATSICIVVVLVLVGRSGEFAPDEKSNRTRTTP